MVTLSDSIAAVRLLRQAGHTAYLVGGCVRDLLLGGMPNDFDIATSATPAQVVAAFPGSNLVGAHFGVVVVEDSLEVATFRSDHAYLDGRRPESVTFETDPRQDALRRDFTINALFLDPETDEVLDFVGGKADIAEKVIRAIGDPLQRFAEDHLRLLRAVRFAARLGFTIEPATLAAIQSLAPSVHAVSVERIRDEISRILTEGRARRGFELLAITGLLTEILPEIAAMKGVAQPPAFHPEGDVWTHTLLMLEGLPAGVPLTLALGVLLHDVGKPSTFRVAGRIRFDGHVEAGMEIGRAILQRLRYSHDEIDQVVALIANHMRFKDAPRMRESTLKRFLRIPRFEEHLELHRLDCVNSHGNLENYELVREKLRQTPIEVLKPDPLLRGEDLIIAGYQPGPAFSKMLTMVEDAQLDGQIRTKREALELIQTKFPVLQSN
jgi:poly(A) polymerase